MISDGKESIFNVPLCENVSRRRDKLVIDILSRLLNADSFVAFYAINLRLHA